MSISRLLTSQEYYDILAREFRAQDTFWDNPYDCEIWRLEHDLMRPYLGGKELLIDIGCGFYPHFEFSRERVVVAGDVSFGSLVVAKYFGDESEEVKLVQFDAMRLPFTSESFGYAIAGGELLNHLRDYKGALDEIKRILKPNGYLLVQVGAKWCFDSIWALLDSLIGHRIGYSLTKKEAMSFFRLPCGDVRVTWAITPSGNLIVWLLSIRRLKIILRQLGFTILQTYGADSVSGLIPLPVQQESQSKLMQTLTTILIQMDRVLGRIPPFRTFAGNVFMVCQRKG